MALNAVDGTFFGDPAVRLNTVVTAVQNHLIGSICNKDFRAQMEGIAQGVVFGAVERSRLLGFRQTIKAAEIATVGDANPQIADDPAVGVGQ